MIDKIKQHQWVNYGRWVQPPLSGIFWCYWNETQSLQELFGKRQFHHILFLDGCTLMNKKDQECMQSIISEMFKSNSTSLFRMKLEHIATKYKHQHLAILYTHHEDGREYIKELFYTYQEIVGLWWCMVALGDEVQAFLLNNHLVASEDELLKIIQESQRVEKTWLEVQTEEINVLAWFYQKIGNTESSLLQDAIASHVSHFDWFGSHHWTGGPYTEKDCLKHIQDRSAQSNISGPDARQELVGLLRAIMFWRTHFAEVTASVVFRSRTRLQHFAKSAKLTYDELLSCSSHEVVSSFPSKKSMDSFRDQADIRLERREGYGCFVDEKGFEYIFTSQELSDAVHTTVETKAHGGIVQGNVASKGPRVRAAVTVLFGPKDFAKFEKGNILVAPETTPDFIPYMKLASAVITDRGGVTSHAAIVSRELGIPCITGTQHATIILEDGMIVEVDTERNTVSVIQPV